MIDKISLAKLKYFLLLLMLLILSFILFCVIRFRGSKVVRPDENINITENIVFFRQDDSNWYSDKLGSSSYNMKSSGCLVSCIASALSMSGEDISAGNLNRRLSEQNVYDSEGNLLWNNLREIGYEVEVFSEVSESILLQCLQQNQFPIVRVRVKGIGSFHYVLIVKAENQMFYCMDPLQDGLIPLSDYGNRVYAVRCVSPESIILK